MSRIRAIRDPEFPKEPIKQMPEKMKMRNIKVMEAKAGGKTEVTASAAPDDTTKDLERICGPDRTINILSLASLIVSSEIESIGKSRAFVIKSATKKLWCGPVLQRVPIGAYTRIGGGESVAHETAPVEKKPNPIFKFDRKRQIALRVGNNVGRDYVILVAANGCILLETGSYASLHMPVFIVEQNGDYYKVNGGNRILLLGPGSHLIVYTNEAPILFVRKDTATRKQSIVSVPKSSDTDKTGSKNREKSASVDSKSTSQEKTGSKFSSADKIDSKDRSNRASADSEKQKTQAKDSKTNSPLVVVNTQTQVPTVTEESPPVVVKKSIPTSPLVTSPPATSETPQVLKEPKELAPSPTSTASSPQSSVVARYPATIDFGPPIDQTARQAIPEPEVVMVRSRGRTVVKWLIIVLFFLLLLFLFLRFRRSGATGPRLPKKICRNCGRQFEPRD